MGNLRGFWDKAKKKCPAYTNSVGKLAIGPTSEGLWQLAMDLEKDLKDMSIHIKGSEKLLGQLDRNIKMHNAVIKNGRIPANEQKILKEKLSGVMEVLHAHWANLHRLLGSFDRDVKKIYEGVSKTEKRVH